MAVTVHDHITSPVVFANTYRFLIISDVGIMVTTNILAFDPCATTNYEDSTRYLLHLNTGLHAASYIKPSGIVNFSRQMIYRDVFLL